jgi:hypothetical protein
MHSARRTQIKNFGLAKFLPRHPFPMFLCRDSVFPVTHCRMLFPTLYNSAAYHDTLSGDFLCRDIVFPLIPRPAFPSS